MHRILHFNKEQSRDKKYFLKVCEYMFNNNKYDSSIIFYSGTMMPNGNIVV